MSTYIGKESVRHTHDVVAGPTTGARDYCNGWRDEGGEEGWRSVSEGR